MINLFQVMKKKLIILIILTIACEDSDILKIIRNIGISKTHSSDSISARMVKLCDNSLVKPLSVIFQKCIKSDVFLDSWKKSDIVPIHKKMTSN